MSLPSFLFFEVLFSSRFLWHELSWSSLLTCAMQRQSFCSCRLSGVWTWRLVRLLDFRWKDSEKVCPRSVFYVVESHATSSLQSKYFCSYLKTRLLTFHTFSLPSGTWGRSISQNRLPSVASRTLLLKAQLTRLSFFLRWKVKNEVLMESRCSPKFFREITFPNLGRLLPLLWRYGTDIALLRRGRIVLGEWPECACFLMNTLSKLDGETKWNFVNLNAADESMDYTVLKNTFTKLQDAYRLSEAVVFSFMMCIFDFALKHVWLLAAGTPSSTFLFCKTVVPKLQEK